MNRIIRYSSTRHAIAGEGLFSGPIFSNFLRLHIADVAAGRGSARAVISASSTAAAAIPRAILRTGAGMAHAVIDRGAFSDNGGCDVAIRLRGGGARQCCPDGDHPK